MKLLTKLLGAQSSMPIRFAVNGKAGLITTAYSGNITGSEYVQTYQEIFASTEFRPGMCELADLREMTAQSAGTREFRQVALMGARAHGPLIRQVRTAILTMTRFQYGLSRMYATNAELLGTETAETFDDPAAALEWLGVAMSGAMPVVIELGERSSGVQKRARSG